MTTAPNLSRDTASAERDVEVNGLTIHYRIAGEGPPVVLLHGYTQTSRVWLPAIAALASTHTVIAPDLRGAGGSSKPGHGYDKKTMASDIHALVRSLGYSQTAIVGHDIGMMVAYAYAAQYPDEVDSLTLMDGMLPGIGAWKDVWLRPDKWHFHFYGETPLNLVSGRERIYFEHFWNDFAANGARSVSEDDRQYYASIYARPGGMRAGFEYFRAFEQDAADFEAFSRNQLTTPTLVLAGTKAYGSFLVAQARLVSTPVQTALLEGVGHWLMDEAPDPAVRSLVSFLERTNRRQ
jgi:pimeloyl-ACP methyl ester carboxylesterase